MKRLRVCALVLILTMISLLTSCAGNIKIETMPSYGKIYLYGEQHGVEKIMDKELEFWGGYYNEQGIRHLFVELPYYTAEFLNIWMHADNDGILEDVYNDSTGTAANVPYTKVFYQTIKTNYPETVFHGTDVGHQYDTTGARFLEYLRDNDMQNTEAYELTTEAIAQGKRFYRRRMDDAVYREDKMVENFIREFDKLNGESVMGIYGAAHIPLDGFAYTSSTHPCMANQLKARYGENITSEDLSWAALLTEPVRIDTLFVDGKEYSASYFGEQDTSSFSADYIKREFWRLENAYDDFSNRLKTGDYLPENNYTMPIDIHQVFVIDYTRNDGTVERMYYRSDGEEEQGQLITEQFALE